MGSFFPSLSIIPQNHSGMHLKTKKALIFIRTVSAVRKGLEPSTSGVTGRRSNQLNYRAIFGRGTRT